MLRSFWEMTKNFLYDNTLGLFRSQEDIDIAIENRVFATGANIVYDFDEVPEEATGRRRTFLNIEDAIKYWTEAGIPSSCVTVLAIDNAGDIEYILYILEQTP